MAGIFHTVHHMAALAMFPQSAVLVSHIVAHELLYTHHTTENLMHAAEIVALHYKLLRWL